MSSKKPQAKKTIVTSKKPESVSRRPSRTRSAAPSQLGLIYGWSQYKWILIGIGLVALGMILMAGGHMPSPDVWDDSLIYSFRRTVLAPFLIMIGLLVEVYALFKD